MIIDPELGSSNPSNKSIKVVLPPPLSPIKAMHEFFSIFKFISLKTYSDFSEYLKLTDLKSIELKDFFLCEFILGLYFFKLTKSL